MGGRLVLVRHGESEWNAAGRWQGHGGTGLTARGHLEAKVTAAYLRRTAGDARLLARSDLERVAQSAAPTAALLGLPERVDTRLREIDVGRWSGLTRAEVQAADPDTLEALSRGEDAPRGGAETYALLRQRVVEVLTDLALQAEGLPVLVFTHGGPIRVAAAEALGLPAGAERRLTGVGNCSVTTLDLAGEGFRLAAYNCCGHLEAAD